MYESFDLNEVRKLNPEYRNQNLFEHQKDAHLELSKLFNANDKQHKAGLLVLPTGAGKTLTSVNWICKNIFSKHIKVLWLAHTSHLLEQACETFKKNIIGITQRETINMRMVSSNPEHSDAAKINLSDDILIMTTQTAISNWDTTALDGQGNKRITAFEKFIENAAKTGLFLVLDEAHHAPAYGCRNLLVGNNNDKKGIRNIVSHSYFLGLTATPTYNDKRRRGWLFEIFSSGIIYEAKKDILTQQGILAVPNYIQKNTGEEFEVEDKLYNHLMKEHKDLPEDLIEKMATTSGRNDYIVNEYISNKSAYKKTIIFADRWHQCVYIKEKLNAKGIRSDAIYTHIDAKANSAEQRNQRTPSENAKILENFKNNQLDVLLNVKMLTEGTDVPDVNTVFITRQTTSPILLTQMIGRALRGKKAGGGQDKDVANIVLFNDNWKKIINFAIPDFQGDKLDEELKVRGHHPLQYISIALVEELARKIDSGHVFSNQPFLDQLPIGWYEVQLTISVDGEMNTFKEFIIVYQNMQVKFTLFINEITGKLAPEWAKENLEDDWTSPQVEQWINLYFDREQDDNNNILNFDLIRLARHIAQSNELPPFYSFEERDQHDLSKIAFDAVKSRLDDFTIDEMLTEEFNSSNKSWKLWYKTFERFASAFDAERRQALNQIKQQGKPTLILPKSNTVKPPRELTEEQKKQILKRDNYTCLCCGRTKEKGKRIILEVDHITPVKFDGETTMENSQTLCKICNNIKRINEIDFRVHKTPLECPQERFEIKRLSTTESIEHIIKRGINFFYYCQAVKEMKYSFIPLHQHYRNWEIILHQNNSLEWLIKHKATIENFITRELKYSLLLNLVIK